MTSKSLPPPHADPQDCSAAAGCQDQARGQRRQRAPPPQRKGAFVAIALASRRVSTNRWVVAEFNDLQLCCVSTNRILLTVPRLHIAAPSRNAAAAAALLSQHVASCRTMLCIAPNSGPLPFMAPMQAQHSSPPVGSPVGGGAGADAGGEPAAKRQKSLSELGEGAEGAAATGGASRSGSGALAAGVSTAAAGRAPESSGSLPSLRGEGGSGGGSKAGGGGGGGEGGGLAGLLGGYGSDSSEDGDGGGGDDRAVTEGLKVGNGPNGPGGAAKADGKGRGAQQGAGGGGGGGGETALPNPLAVLGDEAVVRQGVVLGPRATNADVKGGDAWDSGSESDRG